MTSLDEHRALHAEDARHNAQPITRDEGIRQCQLALSRLAPKDSRFDSHQHVGPGDCEECERATLVLRRIGRYVVCVDCLTRRLSAAAKAS